MAHVMTRSWFFLSVSSLQNSEEKLSCIFFLHPIFHWYNRKIEYPGVSWCLKICARRIQLICAATFGLVGSASWRESLRMLGDSVLAGDRSPDFSGFGGHSRKVMIWCHGAIGSFCESFEFVEGTTKITQRIRVIMIRIIVMIRLMLLIMMIMIHHHLSVTVGTLDGRILHQFIAPLLTGFYTSQVVSRILPSIVPNLANGHLNPS